MAGTRIDSALGERIMKAKGVRGLGSFASVFRACRREELYDEAIPRDIARSKRFVGDARKDLLHTLKLSVQSLNHKKLDPDGLFILLGLPTPSDMAKLDDAKLASEVLRLCTAFNRRRYLKSTVPIFGLKLSANKIISYRKSLARSEAALRAAPARAVARVKKFDAALAKVRVAASKAGVKIKGL